MPKIYQMNRPTGIKELIIKGAGLSIKGDNVVVQKALLSFGLWDYGVIIGCLELWLLVRRIGGGDERLWEGLILRRYWMRLNLSFLSSWLLFLFIFLDKLPGCLPFTHQNNMKHQKPHNHHQQPTHNHTTHHYIHSPICCLLLTISLPIAHLIIHKHQPIHSHHHHQPYNTGQKGEETPVIIFRHTSPQPRTMMIYSHVTRVTATTVTGWYRAVDVAATTKDLGWVAGGVQEVDEALVGG